MRGVFLGLGVFNIRVVCLMVTFLLLDSEGEPKFGEGRNHGRFID